MRLEEARAAHAEQDWPRAYALLSAIEVEDLGADDHAALADAAWWLGKLDDSVSARERAYEARSNAGDRVGAALEAFSLSLALGDKGADALASGWRSRAYRLAESDGDSLAAGYLLSMEAVAAFHAGAADECIEKARATIEIASRNNDATLAAWATHVEGLGLIKRGDVEKGWERLDESMVAVTRGRLKPAWVGLMHCGMLVACEEFGDPRRGWQWVEETERWLGSVPGAVLYPGVCRVHKVRIMQLRGTWSDAEDEARRACEDLIGVHAFTAGRAYYEIAEIKRLRGDHDDAQEFYRRSHELGWDPQPGLALLRLAQGRVHAAVAGLRRALDETHDPLLRAALLPHQIDVSLAAGDHDNAKEAANELSELAAGYRSPLMSASAATGRGSVLVAEGASRDALPDLRYAIGAWLELDCSYELARTRTLLGHALRAVGDEDGATLELDAATDIFRRLGAVTEVAKTQDGPKNKEGLSPRELEVLRLIAAGRSNKEIAAELFISDHTVARHVQNIFGKLHVGSRSAATSVAIKEGLT